jgi:hypothetical protein
VGLPPAAHAGSRKAEPALLQLVGHAQLFPGRFADGESTTASSILGATRLLSTGLRREILLQHRFAALVVESLKR